MCSHCYKYFRSAEADRRLFNKISVHIKCFEYICKTQDRQPAVSHTDKDFTLGMYRPIYVQCNGLCSLCGLTEETDRKCEKNPKKHM